MARTNSKSGSARKSDLPVRRSATDMRASAFHEAGHAVVGWYFEFPSLGVTIVRNKRSLGAYRHYTLAGMNYDPPLTPRAERAEARKMILVTYSGLEAQRLVDPDAPPIHGADDEVDAIALSDRHQVWPAGGGQIGDDSHRAYLEALRADARRLVRRLRPWIEIVADELVRLRTMSSAQVDALLLAHEAPRSRS